MLFSRLRNCFNQPLFCSVAFEERKLLVTREGEKVGVAGIVEVSYGLPMWHGQIHLSVFPTNCFAYYVTPLLSSIRWHGQVYLSVGVIRLSLSITDKQVCPCHRLSMPPTHSSPVSGTNSISSVARTSLLVRGIAGSILLAHGQTRLRRASTFVRATVCLCHYFARATSFRKDRHTRLPMPTMPTIRKAHWSPRACPDEPHGERTCHLSQFLVGSGNAQIERKGVLLAHVSNERLSERSHTPMPTAIRQAAPM